MREVSAPAPRSGAAALVVGAILVACFLAANRPWLTAGLWRDEAGSVYVASAATWKDFFFRYGRVDYSPPLFDGLLAGWGRLWGFGEWSLEIFAVLLGVGGLAAVGFAGAEIAGPWAGLFATLFLLDDDIVFWEFHQVRPYMLSVVAAGLALVCLLRLDRSWNSDTGRRHRSTILLSGSLVLLAFSHYAGTVAVASLTLVSLGLSLFSRQEVRRFWRRVVLCAVPAGTLFLFWLPAFLRQRSLGVPWRLGSGADKLRNLGEAALMMLPQLGPHRSAIAYLPAAAVIAGSVAFAHRIRGEWRRRPAALTFLIASSAGVALVMAWSGGAFRYLIIPAACTAIVFACSTVFLGRALREKGVPGLALVVLGSLVAAGPVYGEAYRRTASKISVYSPARSGIRRLAASPEFDRNALFIAAPNYLARTLWYYGVPERNLRGFPPMHDITDTEYGLSSPVWSDPNAVARFLQDLRDELSRGQFLRVIVVTDANPVPEVARGVRAVLTGCAAQLRPEREGSFSGYPETVGVAIYSVR